MSAAAVDRVGPGLRHADGCTRGGSVATLSFVRVAAPYLAFVLLLAGVWAPGVQHRGFNYETTLVYDSETRSVLAGFLWNGDPLRKFTSVFYHVGYLLGSVTGNGGDYIFYQYVYAVLWLGRAVLMYWLVRTILPGYPLAAYIAGALVIVHASDGALNWVGQLNQFGFMFWLVLGAFLLARALKRGPNSRSAYYLAGAIAAEYLSLYSYESPLPLIAVLPFMLQAVTRAGRKFFASVLLAWSVVPGVYAWQAAPRYLGRSGGSYQQTVMDTSLSVGSVLGNWMTHVAYSLSFWQWQVAAPWVVSPEFATAIGVIGGLGFAVLSLPLLVRAGGADALPPVRTLFAMLGLGGVILLLSFPVYLVLAGNTSMWRTQMLSGFGTALTLTALFLLAGRVVVARRTAAYVSVGLAAIVIAYGVRAGIKVGGIHEAGWERYREVMWQVVNLVPDVQPESLILLANLPVDGDPFGDGMWFDFPVRMAYPSRNSAGGLVYSGEFAAAPRWQVAGDRVKWQGVGYPPPPELREVMCERLILLDYGGGTLRVLDRLPTELGPGALECRYVAGGAIIPGPLSSINVRRYSEER